MTQKRPVLFRPVTVILVIFAVCLFLLGYGAVQMLRATSHMGWVDWAPGQINRLAIAIELFGKYEGRYPESWQELLSKEYSMDRGAVSNMVNGGIVHYTFQVESNGFAITASKAGCFTEPAESMTRRFSSGEALR